MAYGILSGLGSKSAPADDWRHDAINSALLRAGAQMMAAGGPSATPVSFGQAMGQGLLAGSDQMDRSRMMAARQKALESTLATQELQRSQLEAQMSAAQQEAGREEHLRNLYSPEYRSLEAGGGPTPQAASMLLRNRADPRQFMSGKGLEALLTAQPKSGYKERDFPMPNGKIQKQVSQDGGMTWEPMGSPYDRRGNEASGIILPATEAKRLLGSNYDPRLAYQKTARGEIKPVGGRKSSYEVARNLSDKLESHPTVKTFNEAWTQFEAINEAVTRNTRASDVNLVYALAKLYDPNSVVREGEYDITIKNTNSLPASLLGYIKATTEGKAALQPTARKQIYDEAVSRIGSYRRQAQRTVGRYKQFARMDQVNPDRVDFRFPEMPKPPFFNPNTARGGDIPPPPPGFVPVQ